MAQLEETQKKLRTSQDRVLKDFGNENGDKNNAVQNSNKLNEFK